jgi:hypothetical protein
MKLYENFKYQSFFIRLLAKINFKSTWRFDMRRLSRTCDDKQRLSNHRANALRVRQESLCRGTLSAFAMVRNPRRESGICRGNLGISVQQRSQCLTPATASPFAPTETISKNCRGARFAPKM